MKGLALALALSLAIASGCGKDHSTTPAPTPPPTSPVFDDPDTLMACFVSAYTGMSLEKYRAVLHPGFRFLFDPVDVARLGLPYGEFLRSEDLGATANIFSGAAMGQGGGGDLPGITAIDVTQFEREEPWSDSGSDDPDYPHTLTAIFNVELRFSREADATTLVVSGQQRFYVAGRDSLVGGETKTYYRLCGQRDLTGMMPLKSELPTWGGIKALYYSGPISPAPPDLFPRDFPDTPDKLMAKFKTAYATRDIAAYRAVLADSFRFRFNTPDVMRFGLPGSYLTRAEDLGSTANMFAGGVSAIDFIILSRWAAWAPHADPAFPNTRKASYTVELDLAAGAGLLNVYGEQVFYVSTRDSTCDGVTRPYCQLGGQVDLTTAGKPAAQETWGGVKELFRVTSSPAPPRGAS